MFEKFKAKFKKRTIKKLPKSISDPDLWKKFDIKKAVKQDGSAAIALLQMVITDDEILNLVVKAIEAKRERFIAEEKNAVMLQGKPGQA